MFAEGHGNSGKVATAGRSFPLGSGSALVVC